MNMLAAFLNDGTTYFMLTTTNTDSIIIATWFKLLLDRLKKDYPLD